MAFTIYFKAATYGFVILTLHLLLFHFYTLKNKPTNGFFLIINQKINLLKIDKIIKMINSKFNRLYLRNIFIKYLTLLKKIKYRDN